MTFKGIFKRHGHGHDETEAGPSDASPPGYTPQHHTPFEEAPDYTAPHFSGATGDSTTLAPATRKFPPTFNSYGGWSSSFYLGPSKKEKLFAAKFDLGWSSSKPCLMIYDGPTDDRGVLASMTTPKNNRAMSSTLSIFPTTGAALEEPMEIDCGYHYATWRDARYAFSMPVTGKLQDKDIATTERFEWRTTAGEEVKELCGSHFSRGWKLVRLDGPEAGRGGDRGSRGSGFASDGNEVVAVAAYYPGLSMSKGMMFAFMGAGLTGTLGVEWEVGAVATGVLLFYMAITHNAAAAGSS